ncbi:T-cell surface glycoprotein CD1a-like [Lepus europaeus]|uniref:T-cell surface glycoprotein CD1a-like n=1 Tax=Lepus europaeus TaxID=9983 RepID=UPI002B481029|nr:T-cell surface glycoprotein CD1a-like [Lepus europaeus]
MLFLFLPLLAALLPGSDNKVGLEEPVSLHVIQTSYFYNRSWVQNLGSAWLGDLETHRWEGVSGTIVYLWPWSKGNFSNKELTEFETFFHSHFGRYITEVHNFAKQLKYEYPFVFQYATGCELHSGKASAGFLRKAYQGTDLLSFQNKSWVPSPQGGSRAKATCRLLNSLVGLTEIVHRALSYTCPRFLLSVLDAGKADIQQKVKPEAWLSSGPSPGPGRLLLVCHVSGFYPKPVWVMWMRGDQEQPRTQPRDLLPNADRTWYLRVTLDVAAGEASGLSCRVKHSSLGDQDIILYWDHHSPAGFIFLAVIMLVALLAGLAFWFRKYWIHHGPLRTRLPLQ